MSALSDAISKHAPDPKLGIDEWFNRLDAEDKELVERVAKDPSWPTMRVHRMVAELGVTIGKDAVLRWRRGLGFPG